jgi:hypothetical protein
MRQMLVIACVVSCLSSVDAVAADVYVDNLVGSDAFDGRVSRPIDTGSGPVRTLRRAMQVAGFGDQIVLTRTGAVYYDSLSLTGVRNSGSEHFPFTLIGNGATLSGLRAVPPQGWRPAGPDLWKLTLTRKGFYRLMRDGQPLPEFRPEAGIDPLSSLPAGEWTAFGGSVYFHADGEPPSQQSFAYAADQTGLSLYQVDNVRIVDLTLRDFRFDGVHAQNMCRNVTLENVSCINNGRAGIAISGSSQVEVIGGKIEGNGRFQVRIANAGAANLRDVAMDGEPALVP